MAYSDLAQLPTGRRPVGREQQVVWDLIQQALSSAPGQIRRIGGFDENDWFYVLVCALNIIIATRDRETAAHPDAGLGSGYQQNLAYADHYLQMRADAFNLGPDEKENLEAAVMNYDLLKVRGLAFRTGVGPVTPATDVSVYWGMQGIEDGFADRKTHALTDHNTSALVEVVQFTGQQMLLSVNVIWHIL